MKHLLFKLCLAIFCMAVLSRCGDKTNSNANPATGEAAAAAFDPSDPASVVQQLFEAAKADDPNMLFGLCDPEKKNDGDTDCLCALSAKYVPHQCAEDSNNRISWEEFKENFAKGSISGKPKIEGSEAEVAFYFGPGGHREESMTLANREGKWYLISF